MGHKEVHECDICPPGVPMELEKNLGTIKGRKGVEYRRRRFVCPICGATRAIYGNGSKEEKGYPASEQYLLDRQAKIEDDNEDRLRNKC